MQSENPVRQSAVGSQTFLDKLRYVTSPSHKKLEQLPISAALTNPNISRDIYFEYLALMYNIVADAETNIFPQLKKIIPDLDQRRKSDWLKRDLHFGPFDENKPSRPLSADGPFSDSFALGIFYVLEGSTLGGRYILKNINETLALDETNGASYFFGYGNQTGNYWKNFLATLTQYESFANDSDSIIAGAEFAFDAIYNHFAGHTK